MSADSRNIVLVSIDSLRADHCGFLGDDRELTPAMDRLASEGVSYQQAIAPGPQTFSSMPAIFTGQRRRPTTLSEYPQETHWARRLAGISEHLDRYSSLAERLGDRGYSTAGISPNPWTSSASGFDRGFDQFVEFADSDAVGWLRKAVSHIPGVDTESRAVSLAMNLLSGNEFFSQWNTLYDDIERARASLTEPYFLWVFILDCHFPFVPTRQHRVEQSTIGTYYSAIRSAEPMRRKGTTMSTRARESMLRSYRDTVRASDAFVDTLQNDFADDDPVLFVHADHGESFGEHGNFGHHHRSVYEENIHVPYFVHNAGVEATVDRPTSLTSIHDTALSIAREGRFDPGVDTATGQTSRFGMMKNGDAGEPAVVAASECGTNRTLRGSPEKYLSHDGEQAVFNLAVDPDERVNLADENPHRTRELRNRLEGFDDHRVETGRIHHAVRQLASLEALSV